MQRYERTRRRGKRATLTDMGGNQVEAKTDGPTKRGGTDAATSTSLDLLANEALRTASNDVSGDWIEAETNMHSATAHSVVSKSLEAEKLVEGGEPEEVNIAQSNEVDGIQVEGGEWDVGHSDDDLILTNDKNEYDIPEKVRTVHIGKYEFDTYLKKHGDHDIKIVIRATFGSSYILFRNVLKEQGIEEDFKKSCFGHFLDLSNVDIKFPMKLVKGMLLRRIYCKKKKEIWIDYNGMPIHFGFKEFVMMTWLNRCTPGMKNYANLIKGVKANEGKLVSLVGKGATSDLLITKIKDPEVCKRHKIALSLVWFVHNMICSKGTNKKVDIFWLQLASKRKLFNVYPWAQKSFDLTIEYLLKDFNPETNSYHLYGFPWAFAAWAFEAIPAIRWMAKDYSTTISFPRIIRWLAAKPGGVSSDDPLSQTPG